MFIYFLFSHSSSAVIMILICLVSFTIHVVFGTFVSTPPATGTNCTGSDVTLSWAYTPPAGASTNLVEWKKGDDSILILVVSTGQLVYGNIYDNTGLIHIADGEIKLLSINESTSGAYTCEVRYSSGSIDISNQHVLNVIDIFNTSITCTCDSKEIHCVLPTQINKVTINGTLHSLPYRRSDATSYHICMAGEAASCLADSIDKCVTLDSCPKGPESTTDEPQSTSYSSKMSTASSHSTSIMSVEAPTVTVSLITDDNQVITFNSSVFTENKSVLAPLVISVCVLCFCLVVITIVVICVVYRRQYEHRQQTMNDCLDECQPPEEPPDYHTKGHSTPNSKKSKKKSTNFQPEPKCKSKISSDNSSYSIRNTQQQRGRYGYNGYAVYKGHTEKGDYLPHANCDNTHIGFRLQSEQMNTLHDYRGYHGKHIRRIMNPNDPYYFFQTNSEY